MEKERREVASLTKIMTFYTALQLVDKYEIDIKTEFVTVCDEVSAVTGTTANLLTGDKMTVEQLFYGLMLPSGNDAAHCLAKFFGEILVGVKAPPSKLEEKSTCDSDLEVDGGSEKTGT
jgi:D-alanyl-D-alanine carboxypeptidase (penicillin-binding protein 5/6)